MSALPVMRRFARAAEQAAPEKADYTLRIATGLAELAPDHIVSTTLYDGQFPGPLIEANWGDTIQVSRVKKLGSQSQTG